MQTDTDAVNYVVYTPVQKETHKRVGEAKKKKEEEGKKNVFIFVYYYYFYFASLWYNNANSVHALTQSKADFL